MAEIQTGVDRLINLVKEKKIISVDQAAKLLSVDTNMIENLAEILENQGLVSIKYRMTNEFIIDREFAASKKAGITPNSEKPAGSKSHERKKSEDVSRSEKAQQSQQAQNLKKAFAEAKRSYVMKKQEQSFSARARCSRVGLEQERKELKSIKSKFERAAKRKDKILSELSECIKREEKAISEIKRASSKRIFKILFPFTDKTKTEIEFRKKILNLEFERKALEKKAKRLKESLRF